MNRHAHCFTLAATVLALLTTGCRSALGPEDQPILFFPPPPAEARVQFLTWASGANEVGDTSSSFDQLLLGEEEDEIQVMTKPYGIAARDGVVYVCDTKGYNLTRMDFKNKEYSVLGDRGPGRLRKPLNVAVDGLGYKFVVDSIRKQIVVFGPDDSFTTAFDVPRPCHPVDLAIYGDELYVLDNDDDPQVVVFDRRTGQFLRSFGSLGQEPGQFKIPGSICIDPDGFVYVSDTLNFRIQKLTREGEPIWEKGSPGRRLGQFGRPRGIRCGPDGLVYVVEGAMQLVQLFDSDGQILMSFGGPGNTPGGFVLPSTLAVDATSLPYFQEYVHKDFNAEYLLFVANQYGGHLVNVYAFGSFPEGYRMEASSIATLPEADENSGMGPLFTGEGELPSDPTEGNEPATGTEAQKTTEGEQNEGRKQ